MKLSRRMLLAASAAFIASAAPAAAQSSATVEVATPMAPPEWAMLERTLLKVQAEGAERFFNRYFDERGYLLVVERWGANDGPDDAIENINGWPQLYALGGSDKLLPMINKAYEGHVRQYSEAKTTEVPFAREGMYYKEFPVMMDWQHNGEGMTPFNVMGLADPENPRLRDRIRRFADFYVDPAVGNYDPQHKIIKSMFNGSRGPLLRKTTSLDWAGDPIDVARFDPKAVLHGERNFEEMLAHYKDYGDSLGDNPLNLETATLALNAYMLDHEAKYKDWLLEYVGAWRDRARANNNLIPSNIGLDGKIGGEVGGKWYGGTYGWGFSPIVPQTGLRQDRNRGPRAAVAFQSAYLLTGDDSWLDVWRKQADVINAQKKIVDGKVTTPRMYGDNGWYGYVPGTYDLSAADIYILTMKASDRARAPDEPWLLYLEGKNPNFPIEAMRKDLAAVRTSIEKLRADTSTEDTRLADTVMDQNPARVAALIHLMQGGIHMGMPGWSRTSPSIGGAPQHARLRYFDPVKRRPGVPEDVAALVDGMTADTTTVTLVNLSLNDDKLVTVQGGSYGEHQILSVANGTQSQPVNARTFTVRLAPGAGARLTLRMKRYANQPTLDLPWSH
ncbi:hypothetical protein [Sphingomonas sp.]|uniref:hypothetical protein n=1 Tax=Sphingomonas sp. TaxID=28214 RepID=UPI002EDB3B6D